MVGNTIEVIQQFYDMNAAANEAKDQAYDMHWKLYRSLPYAVELVVKVTTCVHEERSPVCWKHVFEVKEIR